MQTSVKSFLSEHIRALALDKSKDGCVCLSAQTAIGDYVLVGSSVAGKPLQPVGLCAKLTTRQTAKGVTVHITRYVLQDVSSTSFAAMEQDADLVIAVNPHKNKSVLVLSSNRRGKVRALKAVPAPKFKYSRTCSRAEIRTLGDDGIIY